MSRWADTDFVHEALEQALCERRPLAGSVLIHSSGRGVPYVAIKYSDRLETVGVESSLGSVGDTYDDALAEIINGLCKAGVKLQRRPWRSFEQVALVSLA